MRTLFVSPKLILSLIFRQVALQEELLQVQRENIELRKQLKELTPTNPKGDEWSFHKTTGVLSADIAKSSDLTEVKKFNEWLSWFGDKFLKPYVHSRVYMEAMTHMRRGLAERIAELQTLEDLKRIESMRRAQKEKRPPASVN